MTTTVTVIIEGDKSCTVAVEEEDTLHEPATISPGTFIKRSIFGPNQTLIVTEVAE